MMHKYGSIHLGESIASHSVTITCSQRTLEDAHSTREATWAEIIEATSNRGFPLCPPNVDINESEMREAGGEAFLGVFD